MENSRKILLVLFTFVIVYFAISYDLADMPVVYHRDADHEWVKYENKTTFHSKLFGDIPIARIGGKIQRSWGYDDYVDDVAPVDGNMWVLQLLNWYKAILIVLLCLGCYYLKYKEGNKRRYESSELLRFVAICGVLCGIIFALVTLYDLSPAYGISETVIIVLFLGNCLLLPPVKK